MIKATIVPEWTLIGDPFDYLNAEADEGKVRTLIKTACQAMHTAVKLLLPTALRNEHFTNVPLEEAFPGVVLGEERLKAIKGQLPHFTIPGADVAALIAAMPPELSGFPLEAGVDVVFGASSFDGGPDEEPFYYTIGDITRCSTRFAADINGTPVLLEYDGAPDGRMELMFRIDFPMPFDE